jgi:hypothetical protein
MLYRCEAKRANDWRIETMWRKIPTGARSAGIQMTGHVAIAVNGSSSQTKAVKVRGCFIPALRAVWASPSVTTATTPAVVPVSNSAVECDPVTIHLLGFGKRRQSAHGGCARRLADASDESRSMLLDERLERHRGTAAELLDEVVGALEDAVLVIDRDLFEVLEEEGILTAR